jgi:hypothetical protein
MIRETEKSKWGTKYVPQKYTFFWGTKRQNGVRMATLNIVQIYHLDIQQKISIDRLMQIIHLLPVKKSELQIWSLQIYSFSKF